MYAKVIQNSQIMKNKKDTQIVYIDLEDKHCSKINVNAQTRPKFLVYEAIKTITI